MKKIYSVLVLLCFTAAAGAQTVSDTVGVYYERASGVNLIGANAGGFFFGVGYYHNTVGFDTTFRISNKIAQHFSTVGAADITELLVWFGAANVKDVPDTITVSINNVSNDSMPTASLGSTTIPVSAITPSATTTVLTPVVFTTPVSVSGDFATVFDYTNVDDTVGFINSADGSGYGEKRTRIFVDALLGGGWKRLTAVLQANWDVDLIVIPVVQYTVGMKDIETDEFLLSLFPSPTSDNVNLSVNMKLQGNVSVNVFDLTGRSLYSTHETMHAGANTLNIDVRDFPAGNYYIAVSSANNSVTGKFAVTK